jgi:hypothetical protein
MSGLAAGSYSLTAKATDNAGAVTTSSAVNVTVSGAASIALPDVVLTAFSYANGIFTCTVKNQGSVPTPSGIVIGVGYFVDGTQKTWGNTAVKLAAGASIDIGSNGGSYNIPTGSHTIMAWVDDVNRFAESNESNNKLSQAISIGGSSLPPTAVSHLIPGTIQAESFNTGGEGVGYHDTDAANVGGDYRVSEGVDISKSNDTGGGYFVRTMYAGEWLKYRVNIASTGTYTLSARVASARSTGAFHIECDGVNVTGKMVVPNTGGWWTWTTIQKTGVSLPAGAHVLRLVVDGSYMNLNWFSLSPGTPTSSG